MREGGLNFYLGWLISSQSLPRSVEFKMGGERGAAEKEEAGNHEEWNNGDLCCIFGNRGFIMAKKNPRVFGGGKGRIT